MSLAADPVVCGGDRFAEGPLWDEDRQILVWIDIPRGEVTTWNEGSSTTSTFDVGRALGAAALRAAGGYVLAVAEGFATCDEDGGSFEVFCELIEPTPTRRMNDGACDALGRFWAGSLDRENPGSAQLHRLDSDRTVQPLLDDLTVSNGLGWNPDNSRMYHVDSPTGQIAEFEFNLDDGVLGTKHIFARLPYGRPDGLTVDSDGCVWVAAWLGSAVHKFAPDGRLLDRIELPVSRVTSCTFGGSDLSTLFVTTARTGSERGRDEERHAGAIFATSPGCQGLPPFRWAG